MGNEQSRQKQRDEVRTAAAAGSRPPAREQKQSNASPPPAAPEESVLVPAHSHFASESIEEGLGGHSPEVAPTALPEPDLDHDDYLLPPSQISRPPRLPLPIEQEVYTPGSPIISPADLSLPLDAAGIDGVLPRRASMLSSTTVDDDDLIDEEELRALEATPARVVPTVIEWRQGGEKVYVTGTFAGWDRKFRLHRG
jgi:hypothetical protein